MSNPLAALGLAVPLIAAPMAGGPTTPAMVLAAARAGGLGFLAGGYRSASELGDQIAAVRAGGVAFGVNLFAPNPVPVDPEAFRRYAGSIAADARRYDLELTDAPLREDDDQWADKLDLLLSDPVPVVSFTFGLPPAATVDALRATGTVVVQTVTSAAEARAADAAGVDVLAVQGVGAGGHSGTFTPQRLPDPATLPDLLRAVSAVTARPLVAAGGLATSASVREVLGAGATAAMVGTVLLRSTESGASVVHRAALADPDSRDTVMTRAFSGRPARAIPNAFVDRYDELAPLGYPALHHLTSPLRRAAAANGDRELVNLWAGTGYREATEEPLASIFERLAAR